MSTDAGSEKDLALSDEDAELVVGGKGTRHKSTKSAKSLKTLTGKPLMVEGTVYPTTGSGTSDDSIYDPELTDPTDPNSPDYVGP